jgi:hypothetical protein
MIRLAALRFASAILLIFIPASASAQSVSILNDLKGPAHVIVEKTSDGLRFRFKGQNEGSILTTTEYKAPLIISAVAKTDSHDIRLNFGRGNIILNWENNPKEFRFRDPRKGNDLGVANQGSVAKNTWVAIRWIIDKHQTRLEVDGFERASFEGDYDGLSGTVGMSTYGNAVISVKSLKVTPIKKSGETDEAPAQVPIDFVVPSAPPATQPTSAPIGDPNAISRAEFKTTPKRMMRDLTSVTAMMVRVAADGQATGMTSEIIGTVPEQSHQAETAGIGLIRGDGDEMMKVALDEAVRAVTLRYPLWERGHIDLSFGEKFVSHGGPSAATGFALLMLSTLEGFEIDPRCAVTGDITVDWKIRKVGGVSAKLRGATLDECKLAVIPTGNETAFVDMCVIYGNSAIWDIQVFSIATLQDAIAVARKDRSSELSQAIALFADLREKLAKSEKSTLNDPQTRDTLKKILELASNHLSAKQTLAICEGNAPKTLSANATIYQMSVLFYPFRKVLSSGDTLDRDALPAHVTALARKRLATLRPIANKTLAPIVSDIAAFIEALDGFARKTVDGKTLLLRWEKLDASFAKLNADPGFVEKLVREAY